MLSIGIIIAILLFVFGAAVWAVFAVSGTFLALYSQQLNPLIVPQIMFGAIDSWVLIAIPFFMVMGNLMAFGGGSRALFHFIDDLIGHIPGGIPAAAILASMLFSAISGSTLATAVAIGGIAIPPMMEMGYDKKFCLGMVAVTAGLGPIIPPSIGAIIYGVWTGIDIAKLFLCGIVPGILLTSVWIAVAVVISIRRKFVTHLPATWTQRRRSFLKALPILIMPATVLGGIYGGIFTPTEAAAYGVFYSLIILPIFYRELNWRSLKQAFSGGVSTTCMIYFIIGSAILFSTMLTFAKLPQTIVSLVTGLDVPRPLILLGINLLYLFFGCIMDATPMFFLTMPILYPLVIALSIDPLHFYFLQIMAVVVGQVTPPFGTCLFTLAGHFHERIETVIGGILPFLIPEIIIWFTFLTYIPGLTTWLPKVVMG